MKPDKPTLYLIRGIPGCGKSTFAKNLYYLDVVDFYIEADDYFNSLGEYKFNPTLLNAAHHWCQSETMKELKKGNSVAVSNTSTTEKEVKVYEDIAKECSANFVSIIVENRHNGTNIHNVPEEKIQQMKNRFSIKL